jgi:hypothetical protein
VKVEVQIVMGDLPIAPTPVKEFPGFSIPM